jgi:hypothetical protein
MTLASNHGLSFREHHSRRTSNCINIRLHIVYQYKFPIGRIMRHKLRLADAAVLMAIL